MFVLYIFHHLFALFPLLPKFTHLLRACLYHQNCIVSLWHIVCTLFHNMLNTYPLNVIPCFFAFLFNLLCNSSGNLIVVTIQFLSFRFDGNIIQKIPRLSRYISTEVCQSAPTLAFSEIFSQKKYSLMVYYI